MAKHVDTKPDDGLHAAVEALVALVVAREGNTPSGPLGALRERAQACLSACGVKVELPRY